jgi:glycosyltransferase involved in cell wall biosynthesis
MGVPSIVGDRSAAREYVREGMTGLYMQGASAEDLTAKLVMLKDDRVLERLSVAAYEDFWHKPPSIDQHIGHLESVYRAVFSANR